MRFLLRARACCCCCLQVASTSDEKLNQPLLQFHKESTADMPLLAVNFDPALVRLLRETRYFLLLRIEVKIQLLHIVMWGAACCWMFPNAAYHNAPRPSMYLHSDTCSDCSPENDIPCCL
jgi:hypothetical protein